MQGHNYGFIPMPVEGIKVPKPTITGAAEYNLVEGQSFGQTLTNILGKANETIGAPQQLTIDAVTKGNVDIHEVMVALGKSEVAFKLISSLSQKVIGGFEKLVSMQV